MGAGWIRGSPCSGDELHLVTVDKLLVGWVIGRLGRVETLHYRDWDLLIRVVTVFRRGDRVGWGL